MIRLKQIKKVAKQESANLKKIKYTRLIKNK